MSLTAFASKPLVDLEAKCSVAAALATMKAQKVTAIALYGDKDHWIGAGNMNVCIGNKQIIGIITVLDIILYIASKHLETSALKYSDLIAKTRAVDIVGLNSESMSLWVADSRATLKNALEPLAKGVHRFLVPIYPPATTENPRPKPIDYQLLSQSDIVSQLAPFLTSNAQFAKLAETPISAFMTPNPVTARRSDPVLPVLTSLASENRMAVPVVDQDGILADTLSASDFRHVLEHRDDQIVQEVVNALVAGLTVGDFLGVIGGQRRVLKGVVVGTVAFGEAVKLVVEGRVHRLWVVDTDGIPVGVLSLGDMIAAMRNVL
ncbi:hypothetical protein HDU98_005624 [Podochytrium sp. JEL0797]|nr:hypothetical protein HDU98_005624 [Podochytrium sp. JEL0797]